MTESIKYPKPSKHNMYSTMTDEYVEFLYQRTRGLGKYKNNPLPCSTQQWADLEAERNRRIVVYILDGNKGVCEQYVFDEEIRDKGGDIIETREVSRARCREILETGNTNLK